MAKNPYFSTLIILSELENAKGNSKHTKAIKKKYKEHLEIKFSNYDEKVMELVG